MKKLLVIMLSLVMALTMFTACGQKEETQDKNETLVMGMLPAGGANEEEVNEEIAELGWNMEVVFYDDLNSMMLAFQSGKIHGLSRLPLACAKYIVARNEGLEVYENKDEGLSYYMGVSEENTQAYEVLNNAIISMKEDGTLDQLREEFVDKYTEGNSEPTTVEMPHFDGASTLKITVTGDVPPLDLVDSDGNPAGYNVAVLAEIAKRAKVNIELVPMNTESRFTALTSGTVDGLFVVSKASTEDKFNDCPEGIKLTESYFEDNSASVFKKIEQ